MMTIILEGIGPHGYALDLTDPLVVIAALTVVMVGVKLMLWKGV